MKPQSASSNIYKSIFIIYNVNYFTVTICSFKLINLNQIDFSSAIATKIQTTIKNPENKKKNRFSQGTKPKKKAFLQTKKP